jgi:hypothetical protein
MSEEIDLEQWRKQAAPFVDDLMKVVNNHRLELPRTVITYSMIHFLALYNQVHEKEPEDSQKFQAWLHVVVDAFCEEARETHRKGDLRSMFTPLQ